MTLYLKAAEDKTSVGDCPFAHFVRLVLEEKGLEYECKPTPPDGKPEWLVNYYDGKMPALRHRRECYVESNIIASYLEYFFVEPSLTPPPESDATKSAEQVLDGLFPAIAKYLKDTSDHPTETLSGLKTKLEQLEVHLTLWSSGNHGYLCGTPDFTLLDARIVPMLYHLQIGVDGFQNLGQLNLEEQYPKTFAYMQQAFARPSFERTKYDPSVVMWGWNNARQ